MAAPVDKIEIEDIRRIEFKPGDRLVLRVPCRIRVEERDKIVACMQAFAPGVPVLILEPGMSLEVLSQAT